MQKELNKLIPYFLKKRHIMELYSLVIEKYINNQDTFCVCADLSRHTEFENIEKKHPNKVINVGIAEQNLLGISAGLASNSDSSIIYTQTLACFLLTRGYDIISQNICNDNLNVKLLGTNAGLSSGLAGISHWIINDIGILKSIPNLTILCPSDVFEVAKSIDYASKTKGPFYIRIPFPFLRENNDYKPGVINKIGFYKFGRAYTNIVISYGYHAELCKSLIRDNISLIELYNVNTFNEKELLKVICKAERICLVEEHFISSGVGETIARLILQHQLTCKYKQLGISSIPAKEGNYEYLLHEIQLDKLNIERNILDFFENKKN